MEKDEFNKIDRGTNSDPFAMQKPAEDKRFWEDFGEQGRVYDEESSDN
jgi:hypothetical protein